MRARVAYTLTSETGDVAAYAEVRVYDAEGTRITAPLYRSAHSDALYPNPFRVTPVEIEFFLDQPARVILGISVDPLRPEILTPVLQARPEADEVAHTEGRLNIQRTEDERVLLRASGPADAVWYRQELASHYHGGPADHATAVGWQAGLFDQITGYPGATLVGGHNIVIDPNVDPAQTFDAIALRHGTWGALDGQRFEQLSAIGESVLNSATGFEDTTAVGQGSLAAAQDATAVGAGALAPTVEATAVGIGSAAEAMGFAVGHQAVAAPEGAVLGSGATADLRGVAVGAAADAPGDAVAIGMLANLDDGLPPGSVLLGRRTSGPAPHRPAVVLGSAATGQEWSPALPDGYRLLLVLQEYLTQVVSGSLDLQGTVAIGTPSTTLGLFGATPAGNQYIANAEADTGIEALDSLVYALRELGLVRTTNAPVASYLAETLDQYYRPGDRPAAWFPVQSGVPAVYAATGREPVMNASGLGLSLAGSTGLVSDEPLPPYQHAIVVARHAAVPPARASEGLTHDLRLTAQRIWDLSEASTFHRDGIAQQASIGVDSDVHVYRLTKRNHWDATEVAIGSVANRLAPGWNGTVVEVLLLDSTWSDSAVTALQEGLTFAHNARQGAEWLRTAALTFLKHQQGDAAVAATIDLDTDYSNTPDRRLVSGRVTNFSGVGLTTIPRIRLGSYGTVIRREYSGAMSGWWSYVDNYLDYWVELYSFPAGFTGTWDSAARVGRFALNKAGTWSTGAQRVSHGEKRWRLVRRSDLVAVPIDIWIPGAFYDVAVQISVVDEEGTVTLQDTVPLQADRTFVGTTAAPGRVIATLVRRSVGTIYATTNRPLPPAVVPHTSDPGYDPVQETLVETRAAALTALAFVAAGRQYYARAGDLLWTLARLQIVAADEDPETPDPLAGALYRTYDGTVSTGWDPVDTTVHSCDLAWVGIAALALGRAVGDPLRYAALVDGIAAYLRSVQDTLQVGFEEPEGEEAPGGESGTGTGSIADDTAKTTYSTETNAVAWLFFRDLGEARGDRGQSGDISGDTRVDIEQSLLTNHWDSHLRRFRPAIGATGRDTAADTWGTHFLVTIRRFDLARHALRSIAFAKLRSVTSSDDQYPAVSSISGYKSGTANVIDHALTWVVMQLKLRHAVPAGFDIAALKRWVTRSGTAPGAGFLAYSADHAGSGRVVRPSLATAAQAALAAFNYPLWRPNPVAPPELTAALLSLASALPPRFEVRWTAADDRIPSAYEIVAERSFDDGDTWVHLRSWSAPAAADRVAPGEYAAFWTETNTIPSDSLTRVRVRMRFREFGGWAVSTALLPTGQSVVVPPPVDPGLPPEIP